MMKFLVPAALAVCSVWAASRPAPPLPLWFEPIPGGFAARAAHARYTIDAQGVRWTLPGREVQLRFAGAARVAPTGTQPLAARVDRFVGPREDWRADQKLFTRVETRQLYRGIDAVFYAHGRALEYDFVVAPGANPGLIELDFRGADHVRITPQGALEVRAAGETLIQSLPEIYQTIHGERRPVTGRYERRGARRVGFTLGAYNRSQALVIDPVLTYSSFLGGSNYDVADAVVAAPDGTIWVAGSTSSSDFPQVGPIPRNNAPQSRDPFVARFDPRRTGADSLLYAAFVGGTGIDEAYALALGPDGNPVIAGSTFSSDFPVNGAFRTTFEGTREGFLAKLDPRREGQASLVYSTFLGGGAEDVINAVAIDSTNKIYVTGYTTSENFPLSANPVQPVRRGGYDAFVTRLDPDGGTSGLMFSTYFGTGGTDIGNAIAVGPTGLIYFTGTTNSTDFPVAGATFDDTYNGGVDGFFTVLDPSRPALDAIIYSTYFGGSSLDVPTALALDAQGNLNIAGYTLSTNLQLAGTATQDRNAGGADGFILRFDLRQPASQQLVFGTYLGGSQTDIIYGLAVEENTRIHVTGYTYSEDFPTRGAVQAQRGGAVEAFVASYDPRLRSTDQLTFATYWGGAGNDIGYGLAVDNACTLHVVGSTTSRNLTVTESGFQRSLSSVPDGFYAAINLCP
jgi:hypothetical protein